MHDPEKAFGADSFRSAVVAAHVRTQLKSKLIEHWIITNAIWISIQEEVSEIDKIGPQRPIDAVT